MSEETKLCKNCKYHKREANWPHDDKSVCTHETHTKTHAQNRISGKIYIEYGDCSDARYPSYPTSDGCGREGKLFEIKPFSSLKLDIKIIKSWWTRLKEWWITHD